MATTDIIVQNSNWKKDFSEKVSSFIGHQIGIDNINSDASVYHCYIKFLYPARPLILVDSKGVLFAVLPNIDYQKLESGTISVEEYLNSSFFYFGYARNTGYLTGVYWQPLENNILPKIVDREKIYRYLKLLICKSTSKYKCSSCKLNSTFCPLCKPDPVDAWKKEVNEYDQRLIFFESLKKQLKKMGFDVAYFSSTDSGLEVRLNIIGSKTIPYVPQWLLNDMLYHPERDWSNILKLLKFRKI